MRKFHKSIAILLIVISLLLGACSSDDKKSSSKKSDKKTTKTVGGTVTLTPLFYSETSSGPVGGSGEMQIELRETQSKNISVAISDDEVQGSGDQWEASAWNAMAVSTLVTGASLDKRQFQVDASGYIDGPSAGALMTVGAISLIRGDKINDDVTMTGTINPDGTVGPVGGIEYKLEGAKKAGKSTVLIPGGQLREPDENGDIVDLKVIGDDVGVDVIEVADIYEAYEEFTGKELPKFEGSEPELTKSQENAMNKVYKKYAKKYDALLDDFSTDPLKSQSITANGFSDLLSSAEASYQDAKDFSNQDKPAAAISRIRESYSLALGVDWGIKLVDRLNAQGAASGIDVINELDKEVVDLFEDFNDDLSKVNVKTLNDAELLIDSYGIMTVATAIEQSGLDGVNANLDEAGGIVVSETEFGYSLGLGVSRIANALAGLEIQQDLIKEVETDSSDISDDIKVETVAKFFRQGADSNLEAFKSIIVSDVMTSANVDEAGAFAILAKIDPNIEVVFNSQKIGHAAKELFGNNDNLGYAELGAAVEVYARSSELMAKYYSLGDPSLVDGQITIDKFRSKKAYSNAENLALEQLDGVYTVLADQGYDSYSIVGEDQLGSIEDSTVPSDAIRGLRHYWKGFVFGRVLSYIGGFPTKGLN